MLLEIAYKSHLKIVIINLYLSILSAQILPLRVTRWHCKNTHCVCSLSAFIATKYCQTHLPILRTLTNSLITIYLRGLLWQLSVVAGHRPLSPRRPCSPPSLHGSSAGAGQGCRDLHHPHSTPCMGTESCSSSRRIEGVPQWAYTEPLWNSKFTTS